MDLVGQLRTLELLLVERLDRLVGDGAVDDALHQHVAQDTLARGRQPPLGQGILVHAALQGLGREQLLVDHLIQHLPEQVRRDVQRLALTDQALRHRLALYVRGPDRLRPDRRHLAVARLGRALGRPLLGARRKRQQAASQRRAHAEDTHPVRRPEAHGLNHPCIAVAAPRAEPAAPAHIHRHFRQMGARRISRRRARSPLVNYELPG